MIEGVLCSTVVCGWDLIPAMFLFREMIANRQVDDMSPLTGRVRPVLILTLQLIARFNWISHRLLVCVHPLFLG